jgi:cell division protein FtsN
MVVSASLLVFAAAIYYVSRPVGSMDMAPSTQGRKAAAKAIEIPPKEPSRFAFYEMLPSYEVVVPEEVINPPKPKATSLPRPAASPVLSQTPEAGTDAGVTTQADVRKPKSSSSPDAPIPSTHPPASEIPPVASSPSAAAERFLIQVAAFRSRSDAEQRVAALTLAGLSARVEQITIDNKDTWFRVRLGPYPSAAAAAAAQKQLSAQGFSGVVMKVKG